MRRDDNYPSPEGLGNDPEEFVQSFLPLSGGDTPQSQPEKLFREVRDRYKDHVKNRDHLIGYTLKQVSDQLDNLAEDINTVLRKDAILNRVEIRDQRNEQREIVGERLKLFREIMLKIDTLAFTKEDKALRAEIESAVEWFTIDPLLYINRIRVDEVDGSSGSSDGDGNIPDGSSGSTDGNGPPDKT